MTGNIATNKKNTKYKFNPHSFYALGVMLLILASLLAIILATHICIIRNQQANNTLFNDTIVNFYIHNTKFQVAFYVLISVITILILLAWDRTNTRKYEDTKKTHKGGLVISEAQCTEIQRNPSCRNYMRLFGITLFIIDICAIAYAAYIFVKIMTHKTPILQTPNGQNNTISTIFNQNFINEIANHSVKYCIIIASVLSALLLISIALIYAGRNKEHKKITKTR